MKANKLNPGNGYNAYYIDIPNQSEPGFFRYNDFIQGLALANYLAIKVPVTQEPFWTRFKLKGAYEALIKLGKPKAEITPNKARPNSN